VDQTMARFIIADVEHLRRTTPVAGFLLACCLLSPCSPSLLAQGGNAEGVYYTSQLKFYVPFTIEPTDQRTQDVLLYYSVDNGRTFKYYSGARRSEGRILFQASADGWYYFAVQTRDTQGNLTPANAANLQTAIKICVDTQQPRILLKSSPPRPNAAAVIEWTIQDDNFDALRGHYRSVRSSQWIDLFNLPQTASGTYGFNPAINDDIQVRLEARDKAGNVAAQTVDIHPGPVQPGAAATDTGPGPNVIHVASTTFQLNYRIDESTVGKSGVNNVRIYMYDPKNGWRLYTDKGPVQGPALITVREAGRYGFTLIPESGAGFHDPEPKVRDLPQIWVEVDAFKPKVQIRRVLVGRGVEAGNFTVEWDASDTWLKALPISIYYAKAPSPRKEDWTKLEENLPNTGSRTFSAKDVPLWSFYIMVEAVDEAGNVGSDQTKEPVKVDLQVPRISIQDVKVLPGEAAPSGMPPATPVAPAQTGGAAMGQTGGAAVGGNFANPVGPSPMTGVPTATPLSNSSNANGSFMPGGR
jgi:hypothetical protein